MGALPIRQGKQGGCRTFPRVYKKRIPAYRLGVSRQRSPSKAIVVKQAVARLGMDCGDCPATQAPMDSYRMTIDQEKLTSLQFSLVTALIAAMTTPGSMQRIKMTHSGHFGNTQPHVPIVVSEPGKGRIESAHAIDE